jgi:protein-S-isoprenylcysteine O-methyltransferase Ste14
MALKIRRKIYPPMYLVFGCLLMAALHHYWPVANLLTTPWNRAGFVLLGAGLLMLAWAAGSFRQRRTPLIPFREPTALVDSGLYRISRNPMYLGMVLVMAGLGLWLGTASPWLVVPVFILVIDRRFIRDEERLMEAQFGDSYREYRKRVRRWL